jgi:hypothetical protein
MRPFHRYTARKIAAIVLGLLMLVILILTIKRFNKFDTSDPSHVQAETIH